MFIVRVFRDFHVDRVLNFTNAVGAFTIDPSAGNDPVTMNGVSRSNVVTVTVTTTSLEAINDLKMLRIPTIGTEKIAVASGQSVDIISVHVCDAVDANFAHTTGRRTRIDYVDVEKFRIFR